MLDYVTMMANKHPMDKLVERQSITVGALAASTGVIGTARVLLQDYVCKMVVGVVAQEAGAIDDAPIVFGIMQGNMTLAELEEAIEADIVSAQGNLAGEERTKRNYQVLGAVGPTIQTVWLEKAIIRLPTFQEDVGFNLFIYNAGDQATTGSLMKFWLQLFGRWL